MGIDLSVVLCSGLLCTFAGFGTWSKYFPAFSCGNTAEYLHRAMLLWLWQKRTKPTFGLCSETTRAGSLIIMSLLHSAQEEPSISCHGVWAPSPTDSQDRLIHNLFVWFDAHTLSHLHVCQWFCYYHLGLQVWNWWQTMGMGIQERLDT